MTKFIQQQRFTGERSLFNSQDLVITDSIFEDGESPLKESRDLDIKDTIFRWKYPLWYCENVVAENMTLVDTARSGIWYTNNITIKNSLIQAPKTFRRGHDLYLENVVLADAQESFWNCQGIKLLNVQVNGNYFGMNSEDVHAKKLNLVGNYAFDGAKNLVIRDSKILSKDAFWNCENVTVYNSTIIGEYLGWNSKKIRFVNCYIESKQGMCYIEDLEVAGGKIVNTNLAFEYSTVKVKVTSAIDSIKNPLSGSITANEIKEIILEKNHVDPAATKISQSKREPVKRTHRLVNKPKLTGQS